MARGLGIPVTAEGIETHEQLERVRALGCDAAQGFLLARPGGPDDIAGLLHQPLGPQHFQLCVAALGSDVHDDNKFDQAGRAPPVRRAL